MPRNRAHSAVTLERELRAWELRQRGYSERAIAAEMKVSQSTVHRLLARIESRLLKRLERRAKCRKVEIDAILDHMLSEALHAWERSKAPRQRVRKRTFTRRGKPVEITSSEWEERFGDVRFLDVAMKIIIVQATLWGVYGESGPRPELASTTVSAVAKRLKALDQGDG